MPSGASFEVKQRALLQVIFQQVKHRQRGSRYQQCQQQAVLDKGVDWEGKQIKGRILAQERIFYPHVPAKEVQQEFLPLSE